MWRITLVGLTLIAVVFPAVAERELRGYDKLGPLTSKGPYTRSIEDPVQDFVWRHWKEHRRGYLVFTVFSVEGEPTTTHLYVEPAKGDAWHIRAVCHSVQSDGRFVDDPQKKPDRHVTSKYEAFSARWIWDHGGRYLQLKDRSGKVVDLL